MVSIFMTGPEDASWQGLRRGLMDGGGSVEMLFGRAKGWQVVKMSLNVCKMCLVKSIQWQGGRKDGNVGGKKTKQNHI